MTFPSGKANCKTSYEMPFASYLTAKTEKGTLELNPSFTYDGLSGSTPDGPMQVQNVNQQTLQIDAFALNILNDTKSIVSGEMGWRDLYLIEKIQESAAQNGKLIQLNDVPNYLDLRPLL